MRVNILWLAAIGLQSCNFFARCSAVVFLLRPSKFPGFVWDLRFKLGLLCADTSDYFVSDEAQISTRFTIKDICVMYSNCDREMIGSDCKSINWKVKTATRSTAPTRRDSATGWARRSLLRESHTRFEDALVYPISLRLPSLIFVKGHNFRKIPGCYCLQTDSSELCGRISRKNMFAWHEPRDYR